MTKLNYEQAATWVLLVGGTLLMQHLMVGAIYSKTPNIDHIMWATLGTGILAGNYFLALGGQLPTEDNLGIKPGKALFLLALGPVTATLLYQFLSSTPVEVTKLPYFIDAIVLLFTVAHHLERGNKQKREARFVDVP